MTLVPNRTARPAVVVLALVAALSLQSCSSSNADSDAGSGPSSVKVTRDTATPARVAKSVTFATGTSTTNLDYATEGGTSYVLPNLGDTLLRLDDNLEVVPGIAESYEVVDDTTIRFDIRQGVVFHDGSTVGAKDVVASLSRHLDPAVGSAWSTSFKNVKSVKAEGTSVVVKLAEPDSLFLSTLTTTAGLVESAKTLKAAGDAYGTVDSPPNLTGPYRIGTWTGADRIVLTKSEGYWDTSLKVWNDSVEFDTLTDQNAELNAYRSGEILAGQPWATTGFDTLRASGSGTLSFGEPAQIFSAIINDWDGPLGQRDVREALLLATDRKGLVAAATSDYADVVNSVVLPDSFLGADQDTVSAAYDALDTYAYDPARAKELVSGVDLKGKEIRIATLGIAKHLALTSQALKAGAESLGFTVTIDSLSGEDFSRLFYDEKARAPYQIILTGQSDFDATAKLDGLTTDGKRNIGGWSDPEYDAIADKARSTYDGAERGDLNTQALKIVNQELPWLPLYSPPFGVWQNDKVTGLNTQIHNFKQNAWAARIGLSK